MAVDDELIIVDDDSTDSSADGLSERDPRLRVLRSRDRLGPAGARNLGAERAGGEHVLFSDAHVSPSEGWRDLLLDALRVEPTAAAGPIVHVLGAPSVEGWGLRFCDDATNVEWLARGEPRTHPVPVLPGAFIGLNRDVFSSLGGFDVGMRGYGMEDVELCVHLWVAGHRCLLVPGVSVGHLYRPPEAIPSYQCDWHTGLANVLRFGIVHFPQPRLSRLVACYADDPSFPNAMASVILSDVLERRRHVNARRRHDGEWFFERCNGECSTLDPNGTAPTQELRGR
jgi:glycosyltransferase involved in cell wall biosynthesis